MLAQHDATSGNLWLLVDGHGSTRALLDASGQVIERYAYDAFGQTLESPDLTTAADAKTDWLFGGDGMYDGASGLTNHIDRWRQGHRFLSLDAYAGNVQDPISLHKYLYAHANPVMLADPTGLYTLGSVSVANGIGSMLAGMQGDVGMNVLDSLHATLSGASGQQVFLANIATSGGFMAAAPILAAGLKISVGHAGALLSKASGMLFEHVAARTLADVAGETIIHTKFFVGSVDRGIDFVSVAGRGSQARLIFNEVKNVNGLVSNAKFTTFGLGRGGDRVWQQNLQRAREFIEKAALDDVTRLTVINQLNNKQVIVRVIGSARKETRFADDLLQHLRQTTGFDVSLDVLFL